MEATQQKKYIAYYRVSTKHQGQDGYGMEAQKSYVERFVSQRGGEILEYYLDVESGKKTDRRGLLQAIEASKRLGATIAVAKLCRLARNASFIMALRDSKVDFIACDMPEANAMTIGIMALVAQDYRESVSDNTRRGLQAKMKTGWVPGNASNFTDDSRRKGAQAVRAAAMENENNRKAALHAKLLQDAGNTLKQICEKLEEGGFKTATGGKFYATSICRILKRYENKTAV